MMLSILRSTSFKVYTALGLMFLSTQIYAENHSHNSSEHNAKYTLNHGKQWETDEVLRQGMDNIRQAIATNQDDIEKDRLSTQEYQRLAETVDNSVANIVKNCKLTKEADAAFHAIVLADLTQSIEFMRMSPKTQVQRAGALGVLQSLRNYGQYFKHSG
jgi:hypothetical protein